MPSADRPPRELTIHQSANRPNQILGADRELVLITVLTTVSLAFSLGDLVGRRTGCLLLDRLSSGAPAYGQSGSLASPNLHAAHPLSTVLSGEEWPVLTVSANAGKLAMS